MRRRRVLHLAGLAGTAALAGCGGSGRDGSDRSYEFSVELYHDDDGEEGYANWWQVERLDGTQLSRRDLAHPHSNQPFTRSNVSPFDIPS